jgi:hypothetical protein
MSVDFPIREIRTYKEPNGVFSYIGYLIESPIDKQCLMILVKTMGMDFEISVFYKDTDLPLYQAAEGQEPCPLYSLLTEDLKDLIKRFDANIQSSTGDHAVTWDLQSVTYGVQYQDTADIDGICTLGEYFTNDENDGNNFCLIDWKGDAIKGFLEVWYGCIIKNHEVEMCHK